MTVTHCCESKAAPGATISRPSALPYAAPVGAGGDRIDNADSNMRTEERQDRHQSAPTGSRTETRPPGSDRRGRLGLYACSMVPLRVWHRALGVRIVFPYWHTVADEEVEHVSGLYQFRTTRQFADDIEFLLRSYAPVSLADLVGHLRGQRQLPERSFLATFDDGFREIYERIGPMLHAKGIPAVFFLVSDYLDNALLGYPQKKSLIIRSVERGISPAKTKRVWRVLNTAGIVGADLVECIRSVYYRTRAVLDDLAEVLSIDCDSYLRSMRPYLTSEEVRRLMGMGFDVGAHSIDHPLFSEIDLKEQLRQVRVSMKRLSESFGFRCRSFAFPYGDAGIPPEFYREAFSDEGLELSFGMGGIPGGPLSRNVPRFSMERTNDPARMILARQYGKGLLRRLALRRESRDGGRDLDSDGSDFT